MMQVDATVHSSASSPPVPMHTDAAAAAAAAPAAPFTFGVKAAPPSPFAPVSPLFNAAPFPPSFKFGAAAAAAGSSAAPAHQSAKQYRDRQFQVRLATPLHALQPVRITHPPSVFKSRQRGAYPRVGGQLPSAFLCINMATTGAAMDCFVDFLSYVRSLGYDPVQPSPYRVQCPAGDLRILSYTAWYTGKKGGRWSYESEVSSRSMTQVEKRWPESSYFLLSREEQQASGVWL